MGLNNPIDALIYNNIEGHQLMLNSMKYMSSRITNLQKSIVKNGVHISALSTSIVVRLSTS